MAFNPNDQSYPGYYRRYQGQQQNDNQNQYYPNHSMQPLPQPPVRRPSFEAGDDAAGYGDSRAGDTRPSGTTAGGHIRMPDHSQFMSGQGSMSRLQTGGISGYSEHGSPDPQGSQYTHAPYNPQQYARAEPQYPQQSSYGSPQMNTSPSMSYQPYVPAAYQPGAQQSTTHNSYSSPGYFSPIHPSTQPATSMPHENDYGPRPVGSNIPYQSQQQYTNYPSSPPAQVTSPASAHPSVYTPPAPPPPPMTSEFSSQPARTMSYDSHRTMSYDANSYSSPITYTQPSGHGHNRIGSNQSQGQADYYSSGDYAVNHSGSGHGHPYGTTDSRARRGGIADQGQPQRTSTERHPHSRPLPGPPADNGNVQQVGDEGEAGVDDLLNEIEAAVMGRVPTINHRPQRQDTDMSRHEDEQPQPLNLGSSRNHQQSNGVGTPSTGLHVNYNAYSDESDAEAAAGLAAMRLAEEQDAADQSRRNDTGMTAHGLYGSRRSPLPVPPKAEKSGSDSDNLGDFETFGGGLPTHYDYSGYGASSQLRPHADMNRNPSASSQRSELSIPGGDYFPGESNIHPFPAFGARTDAGGTGGLSEPGQRRMSFDDGDEDTLADSFDHSSGATSPTRESIRSRSSIQEPKHQHSRTNSRPLPQVPGRRGAVDQGGQRQADQYNRSGYNQGPDDHELQVPTTAVQKANSVASHSSSPAVVPPGRSITDAEYRRKGVPNRQNTYGDQLSPEAATHKYAEMVLPSLPPGKRRKFVPSKLSTNDYKKCVEPWASSAILAWIKEMTEGEADLRTGAVVNGIVALFTHKVPTMNTADAEVLSARIVQDMFDQGALLADEEWVKFGTNPMSGVIFQLTGTGCYSSRVHTETLAGRCYSHHCMRTLKKINLKTHDLGPQRKLEDWQTFYHLKKEDVTSATKREIERQNNLHEIVTSEDSYMDQLDVLRVLYRDGLGTSPDILSEKRRETFIKEVFGKVDAIKQANEEHLLPWLKYRQNEQGPWITGFSDIFREWIRKAKTPYIEYAANFPTATLKVRKEAERNVLFRQFLDQVRENERSKRLGWDTYLKAPITRLQRYGLLLATVLKHSEIENEEKVNLEKAIEEIKLVTMECDSRVAEMSKRSVLLDLQGKLRLRPQMEKVELNLTHLGREIICRGELLRKGTNRVSWVETHAILFDHYMVLAKAIQQRDAAGGLKHEVYDVSKLPIPMDLLILESTNDDPVVKSSVKGIASVSAVSRTQTPQEARLGRVTTGQTGASGGRPSINHANTETSTISSGSSRNMVTNTALDSNDKVMYPFRVKHLGKSETYVLYAPSAHSRSEWCDHIITAKTRHAASLFAQNAEPFKLRVMADTAFNYSEAIYTAGSAPNIKGTPLDRAIEECDRSFYGTELHRQGPICRSTVNCATTFNQPFGKRMVAIGTDFGVFLCDYDSPRSWQKSAAIVASHVTQIAVLEEFSTFLVLADKALVAYHLDSVCPVGGPTAPDSRRPPQKLSGNRDVGFFATGRMKDRMLVFYKKREGISSTFKVLEPVFQKSSTSSKSRFGFRKGTTDFFRDFDDFYIASETFSIHLFNTSLAVSSARGIEVLTLDKKVTFSIPDLKAPHVQMIAQRINGQKPLGMFRLDDNEFLLVFEEVGIYVDKHGDVSRQLIMEFVCRAKQATLFDNTYLVLVDSMGGFVEVRNAVNGRLRQVISGKDVRLLDDAMHTDSVKICLQHPEREKVQLVVEMMVNEGQMG